MAAAWGTGTAYSSDGQFFPAAVLRRIDRAVLKPRDVHLVLDNYATHKTPEVQAWLEKHLRSSCTSRPPAHRG